MTKLAALIAVLTALAMDGCGGGAGARSDKPPATVTPASRVSVRITAPQDGASVKPRVVVRGLVSPANATVDINGEAAKVRAGRFSALVALEAGDEQLQATAAANGVTDQSTVAVNRVPTQAEKRAAARKRAARARRRQAAKRSGSGASELDGSFAMPNEVGMNLQDAQDDVQRASGDPVFVSHSRDATGAGRFQILDRDWKVCGQNVAPGQHVSAVGHVVFYVVKNYEHCP